jgi:hypothetical protein
MLAALCCGSEGMGPKRLPRGESSAPVGRRAALTPRLTQTRKRVYSALSRGVGESR